MNREALQIHDLIVRPVNAFLGLGGETPDKFITFIGEAESGYDNLRQILSSGNYGAAWGWWECEKPTFDGDIEFLTKDRPDLIPKILEVCELRELPGITALVWNLRFAAAMCRIHFLRFKEPIPDDIEGMAEYWKKYYNGPGKGTTERFVEACKHIF